MGLSYRCSPCLQGLSKPSLKIESDEEVISLYTTVPRRGHYLLGSSSEVFSYTDFHCAKIRRSVNPHSRYKLPQEVHSHIQN